jgi:hypothetical protein
MLNDNQHLMDSMWNVFVYLIFVYLLLCIFFNKSVLLSLI